MNQLVRICLILSIIGLFSGCEEWDLERTNFPTVITVGAARVTTSTAILLGDIDHSEETPIVETGFIYNQVTTTSSSLLIGRTGVQQVISETLDSVQGNRAFTALLSSLQSKSLYTFRAYVRIKDEPMVLYGRLDSFRTDGLDISILTVERSSSACQSEAIIHLQPDISGESRNNVSYGIVWHADVFQDPSLSSNVIYAGAGDDNIAHLPVSCGNSYRIRAFISSKEGEVIFGAPQEFTIDDGGTWVLVNSIPVSFDRSQEMITFSSQEKGFLMGFRKESSSAIFLQFDPTTRAWSPFAPLVSFGPGIWAPSSNHRFLVGRHGNLYEYFPEEDRWQSEGSYTTTTDKASVGFLLGETILHYRPDGLTSRRFGYINISPGSDRRFVTIEEWTYPGTIGSATFHIGPNNGYMGLGKNLGTIHSTEAYTEFWTFRWVPGEGDEWIELADLPEILFHKSVLLRDGKGYILTGTDLNENPISSFWEYDPELNHWIKLTDFAHGDQNADFGFVVNGIIYGGLGVSTEGIEKQELWKYVPELK